MDIKKDQMISFWSERAKLFGTDPRANTNDVWLREVEIGYVAKVIREGGYRNLLDFGCANGFSTARLAELNPACKFLGIDINPDMIRIAKDYAARRPNLSFAQRDVLQDTAAERFDLIYAIRAFQNIEGVPMQQKVVDRLSDLLVAGGALLYIESYADGYATLNEDRIKMGLPALPIHAHLTLLTGDFDRYVSKRLHLVKKEAPSSSYYLITRLLYSYIAKMNGEPIDYNHPIHQVAAMVPQIGEYGPQRACLFKKR